MGQPPVHDQVKEEEERDQGRAGRDARLQALKKTNVVLPSVAQAELAPPGYAVEVEIRPELGAPAPTRPWQPAPAFSSLCYETVPLW